MSFRRVFSRVPILTASLSATIVTYSAQKNQSFFSFADSTKISNESNTNTNTISLEDQKVIDEQIEEVKAELKDKTPEEPQELLYIEDVKPENLNDWIEEHKSCSFCRGFIESPCFDQFRLWSICSTESKKQGKEVAQVCTHYFTPLFSCVKENYEFFNNQVKEQEAEIAKAEANKAKAEVDTPAESTPVETPVSQSSPSENNSN